MQKHIKKDQIVFFIESKREIVFSWRSELDIFCVKAIMFKGRN